MAETYKLDIDMLERNGTAACLAATRAMIARIRELERDKADWLKANAPGGWIDDLRRASQPGSGEAEDAARYRFIRDVPYTPEVHHTMSLQLNATMDKVIDAARASLDGRS